MVYTPIERRENMKLIIVRDQESKGMMSKKIVFSITATVELTDQEKEDVDKYKLGGTILYSNMEDRGSGALGLLSRVAMEVIFTVNNMLIGKKIESDNIIEIIALEDIIIEAAKGFKNILEASATFGDETVIEL